MVGDPPVGPEVVGRSSRRCGDGRENLLGVRKGLGDPPGGPSGWKTLSEIWICSADPFGGPVVVGDPAVGPDWSVDHPVGPEVVGRPSRRSGSRWETLPDVRKWSGYPPGGPELVGRPSRRSKWLEDPPGGPSGWETLSEVRKWLETLSKVRNWSGDPPEGPEVVGRPSQRPGCGRETLLKVWKWSETLPKV